MGDNKSGKRIIAIAVSPRAYGEILTLKGDRTWTKWLLELMLHESPINKVLNEELACVDALKFAKPKAEKPKVEPKAEKPKVEKPKAEPKAEKPKAEPKPKKPKAKAVAILEAEPEVEYGKVNPKTGGTWVDISKIGRHEEIEVGA